MPVVEPQSEPEQQLELLIDWEKGWNRPKPWYAALGSVFAHVFIFAVLLVLPAADYVSPEIPRELENVIPPHVTLVAPRDLFTQKAPNINKPAEQLDLAGLVSRPDVKPVAPKVVAPPPSPAPKAFSAPPPSPTPNKNKAIETNLDPAPKIAQNLPPVLGAGSTAPPPVIAPPPPPPSKDKPKLAFETPGSANGVPKGQIQAPQQMSVADSAKAAARGVIGAGMTIGDLTGDPTPGIPALPGTQGKTGNSLELLSDPMGVDFKPYLIRVLAAVRRNWFSVMPESARMGMRGRTTIQFAIAKDGSVPKLVIHFPSGSEHLDRAAVAGISASNPFPPLPAEFRGNQIRLQLVFAYNIPK